MYDLNVEALRREHQDVIDLAARWAFIVYENVLAALQDTRKAADTAEKVYAKLLEQGGVPCLKNS